MLLQNASEPEAGVAPILVAAIAGRVQTQHSVEGADVILVVLVRTDRIFDYFVDKVIDLSVLCKSKLSLIH